VGSVEKRGISGGQRKRVNIGVELVAKPSLLFMDEPTSGLDATAATDILVSLRKCALLLSPNHMSRWSYCHVCCNTAPSSQASDTSLKLQPEMPRHCML